MARILIVDDQPDTLVEMRIILERSGHTTVLAADAERAGEHLAGTVDLVVLDVAMSVGDGWNVLGAAAGRPVLVVSDRATPRQIARALSLGAAGHLPKTEVAGSLVAAVAEALA